MNYREKNMIVDSLLKLVRSSPSKKLLSKKNGTYQTNQKDALSYQELNIWVNYVNSVLDVLYEFAPIDIILQTKIKVTTTACQEKLDYFQRAIEIERIILNLAKTIVNYK